MKLTKEQINKIKELISQGKKLVEISRELNIPLFKIRYYCIDGDKKREKSRVYSKERWKSMSEEERKKEKEKKKIYFKSYFKRRYDSEESFRKKHIAAVLKYQEKKK